MLLTIDAGNTRTKWAVFNNKGEMSLQDARLNNELSATNFSLALPNIDNIVISNVAGKQHATLLTKIVSHYNLTPLWVKASTSSCGVVNSYQKPDTLGSDRWAALIAAWHIKHASCVVVNAGTAVTVDCLSTCKIDQTQHGDFIGGIILPGLNLMQQSLGIAAAQLPKSHCTPETILNTPDKIFAKNTVDAIYNGALLAIGGATKQMVDALEQHCQQEPCIIISGGNGQAIKDFLTTKVTNQVLIVDNLVLKGLYLIEKFTRNQNMIKSEAQ